MTPFDSLSHNQPFDAAAPAADYLLEIESGGETLFGTLLVAAGSAAHPTVILLHGFPGSEKHGDLAHILLRAGCNVLSFSYRGSWGSGGVYSFAHVLADVGAAVAFLRDHAAQYRVDVANMILLGHSVGGWAALMVGAADPGISHIISMAGFNCGRFAKDVLENDDFLIMLAKQSWVHEAKPLNADASDLIDEVVTNQEAWDVTALAEQLHGRAVLLVAAANDDIAAPIIHHEPMVAAYEAAGVALTATVIEKDGHGFYNSRTRLARTILDFIENDAA